MMNLNTTRFEHESTKTYDFLQFKSIQFNVSGIHQYKKISFVKGHVVKCTMHKTNYRKLKQEGPKGPGRSTEERSKVTVEPFTEDH